MTFSRRWPEEAERALVAAYLEGGRSVRAVHEAAVAGNVPGVDPRHVPPVATLADWCTEARRDVAARERGGLEAFALGEYVAGLVAVGLEREAKRAAKSGTPDQLRGVARAGLELVRLRREIDRARTGDPAPGQGQTDNAAGGQDDSAGAAPGFLEGLAAEG